MHPDTDGTGYYGAGIGEYVNGYEENCREGSTLYSGHVETIFKAESCLSEIDPPVTVSGGEITVNVHPGDLIFFDWDHNGSLDHVGVVFMVRGMYIHTIEGNSGDRVAKRKYFLFSQDIAGYRAIDWKSADQAGGTP
jgi:hypothetical protein